MIPRGMRFADSARRIGRTIRVMKRLGLWVSVLVVVLVSGGCSSATSRKFYPGPVLPAESLAVMMTYSPSAYLQEIRGDGVYVGIDAHDGVPMHWAGDALELPPGEYTIIVGIRGRLFESRTWKIAKRLEAGHRYLPIVHGSEDERLGTVDDAGG
jgi:hypothetical protein